MDEKCRLETETFCIESGHWQENPVNVRVSDRAAAIRRNRGQVYILIETLSRGSAVQPDPALYEGVIAAIEDTYYRLAGSITRGLREALLAGDHFLQAQGLTDAAQRSVVGMSCAVTRDNEVYLGQIGLALASLVHQGQLQSFPSDAFWLRSVRANAVRSAPTRPPRELPAGTEAETEPALFHLPLLPGDTLILSSTALGRLATPNAVVTATTHGGGHSLRDYLQALGNGEDLCALVIRCVDAQQSPNQASAMAASDAPLPQPGATTQPQPSRTAGPTPPGSTPSEEPTSRGTLTTPNPPSSWHNEPSDTSPKPENRDSTSESGQSWGGLRRLRDGLSQSTEQARQQAQDLLLRTLPDRLPPPPVPVPAQTNGMARGGVLLVLVALAIPLIMLLLVVLMRMQYENSRRAQFDEVLVLARTRYDAAMKLDNPSNIRQSLYEAQEVVEEGLSISPDQADLSDLQRKIQVKLDQINGVERLYHSWQILQLDEGPVSVTDSSRLVIHGSNVFLLNRGSDRVYRYSLNDVGDALQPVEGNPLLIQKGQLHRGFKVGDIVDIAWLDFVGERPLSMFAMLERNGSLLTYDPRLGVDSLPVADSSKWLKPQAIASYTGYMYILDPLLGRILKYQAVEGAYTKTPESYLLPQVRLDLTGAVDMAIDGNVYVLFADGKIAKFYTGAQMPFSMNGLPTPMRSPTSILVSGPPRPDGKGYVYVADTGDRCVLQFDKAGNYIRQFRAAPGEPQLDSLRGLYVDEEKGRMFLLSGRTLWLTEIPPLPDRK